ncbi:hypothetical protein Fmac_026234 [Flemingia macrophylla]|uniref:Uncharacterized protein n=1 Tax=Flemingia macrophylla TaxID=520843 RepID=A0ABD1LE97_9FABA
MNERDRRTLSFPAVHPCEGVSPPTLLASLITLSQSICSHQLHLFPTQRRNARETIRQLTILTMLLQEISPHSITTPPSTILALSELHFTLQKIHFLMHDLTLPGTRLLLLAKAQHVAFLFRAFVRAIATSLDVIPLSSFHVCREIKEFAHLLTRHARNATFLLHPTDARAAETLRTLLSQFARGTEPDLASVQELIDYLRIQTWDDCNTEINFLNEEISLECIHREEKETPIKPKTKPKPKPKADAARS